MKRALILGVFLVILLASTSAYVAAAEEPEFGDAAVQKLKELLQSGKVSSETQGCISCHIQYTPTIVYEWAMSVHAQHPAKDAGKLYDMIQAPEWKDKIADWVKNYDKVVGCYECHGKFKDQDRPDVIDNHFGYKIVTVVTRKDCSQCHPKESAELSWTWHATGSLHAPVLPWYKAILAYAKKLGADPFGDANAKALYEKYFPPYLTKTRDKDDVTWEFYKEIAKAVMQYAETGQENDVIKFLKKATGGYVTPYDLDWKKWVSPLWPASGVLNTTVIPRLGIKLNVNAMGQFPATIGNPMSHPAYRNGYVYHACLECHGSLVLPYGKETVTIHGLPVNRVKLWGWPSVGAARVDPDGSLGACTACHDRHLFSLKQARHAWTCGRCHLGYDHPHIEIYEESAHGNIENAYGHEWNWERLPWRVGVDFNAPTCATCHMSTISRVDPSTGKETIVVKGTHDFNNRLVWDQMHFFGIPKGIIPDKPQQLFFLGGWSQLKGRAEQIAESAKRISPNAPEPYKYPVFMGFKIVDENKPGSFGFPRMLKIEYTGDLKKHREEMIKVCTLCHSHQWTENYFRTADQNIIDYDVVARYAFSLLKFAWKEGLAHSDNLIDEFPEIMWYYIWHHQGRRWRNGAFMMGPDFAHWFGIVDTVMEALGKMTNWIALQMKAKALEEQIAALKAAAQGGRLAPAVAAQLAELQQQLQEVRAKIAELEASAAALKQQLQTVEGAAAMSGERVEEVSATVGQLTKQLESLAEQLKGVAKPSDIQRLEQSLKELEAAVKALEEAKAKALAAAEAAKSAREKAMAAEARAGKAMEAATLAGEKAAAAEEKAAKTYSLVEEIKGKIEELSDKIDSVSRNTFVVAGVAIALAVIAIGLAVARRQA